MAKTSTSSPVSLEAVFYGSWEMGGPRHYYREGLLLRTLKAYLPPAGQQILDVGCGTGSLLRRLARCGYRPFGVDPSASCLSVTRARLRDAGLDGRIHVVPGDALFLPFPDQTFHGVVAAELLEHLDQGQEAIQEFFRVLQPGGIAVATVPAHPHLYDLWDALAGHRRRYQHEEIRERFESAGFQILHDHTWGFPLMRLYHRLFFLWWARRVAQNRGQVNPTDPLTRVGLNPWVSVVLGTLFRLDDLFARLPWGIGILLVARKPSS